MARFAAVLVALLCLASGSLAAPAEQNSHLLARAYRSFAHLHSLADHGAFQPHVHFQLKRQALESHLESLGVKKSDLETRQAKIDELLERIAGAADLTTPKRIFRHAGKHEKKHTKYGLDLWYRAEVHPKARTPLASVDESILPKEAEASQSTRERKIMPKEERTPRVTSQFELQPIHVAESRDAVASVAKLLHGDDNAEIMDLLAAVEPKARAMLYDDDSTYSTNDPYLSFQDHYETIDLYTAWAIHAGDSDIVVQVIDSGMDESHEDLQDNKWVNTGETCKNSVDDDDNGYTDDCYGYNFADDTSALAGSGDHGIHCAGTISADNDNSVGVAGVAGGKGGAAGASLMIGTVFGDATDGFDEALVYGADNGAHISSNSWGYTVAGAFSSSVLTAIDYAVDAGVLVVFAAGNDGTDDEWYPGYYPPAVAVAALDDDGVIASFSNFGSWINISAPGVSVLSTTASSTYGYKSGTSMACPHVSGILALGMGHAISQEGFSLDEATTAADAALSCLYTSAASTDTLNPSYVGDLGAGLADVPAVLGCLTAPTPAPSATSAPTETQRPTNFPTPQPTFEPTENCGDCSSTLTLTLVTDNFPSETSYSLVESSTGVGGCDVTVSESGGSFSSELTTYSVDISTELCAGQTYTFFLLDSFGDGICCGEGSGSYTITLDGEEVGSGSNFDSLDSTTFTVPGDDDNGSSGGSSDDDETAIAASVSVIVIVFFLAVCGYFYYKWKRGELPKSQQLFVSSTPVAESPLNVTNVYKGTSGYPGVTQNPVSKEQQDVMGLPYPAHKSATAGASRPRSLGPGWQAVLTDEGDQYYWNEMTNQVQWERPDGGSYAPPPPPKPAKPARRQAFEQKRTLLTGQGPSATDTGYGPWDIRLVGVKEPRPPLVPFSLQPACQVG